MVAVVCVSSGPLAQHRSVYEDILTHLDMILSNIKEKKERQQAMLLKADQKRRAAGATSYRTQALDNAELSAVLERPSLYRS